MIEVAQVSKTFGSKGELIVNLFDTFPSDFSIEEPMFVIMDELTVPLFCDKFELRGQSRALVVFSDMNSEKRASEFVGHKLFMTFDDEADGDDDSLIYFEDLAGWSVKTDEYTGIVEEFIDGDNPLLKIMVNEREVFIPAVDKFIVDVDEDNKILTLDLPDGLLELYLE